MKDPRLPNAMLNTLNNWLTRLDEHEARIEQLETAQIPPIEEIVGGRSTIADLILSPAEGILVMDPTSADYTGVFMAGDGIVFDSASYVMGNVVAGVLKTGFTDVGTLYAVDAEISGTITIGAGEAGGWLINSTQIYSLTGSVGIILDSSIPKIQVGDTAGVHIVIDGDNQWIRSSNFAAGAVGFNIDAATGDAEFNNLVARGMIKTAVFEKDVISSVGGSLLVLDSDVLDADMTSADSQNVTIQGNTTFAVGDILRMKDGASDEWLEVTSIASAPTYAVTRDKAGAYSANNNPAWKKGQAVVNYGQSGDGGILLEGGATPRMSVFTHTGSPWSSLSENIVIQEGRQSMSAGEFPSQVHLEWLGSSNEQIGSLLGWYVSASSVNGISLIAREKNSAYRAVVGMSIQGDDQDLGELLTSFNIDGRGVSYLDLRNGTVMDPSSQALVIQSQSSDLNSINNGLYVDSYAAGTPAAGFGSSSIYRAENANSVVTEMGEVGFEWIDPTNGSEKARFRVQAIRNGSIEDHLISATYSPALTNVTNIAASSLNSLAYYTRVGDLVHVAGSVDIDPTATGAIELGIALPIASALTGASQLAGTAVSIGVTQSAAIDADATNDRARLRSVTTDLNNRTWAFHFSYRIL